MSESSRIILVIGKVWPESGSSAAGSRMLQLLDFFSRDGWKIAFASASARSDHSDSLDEYCFQQHEIQVNDSGFDQLLKDLAPDAVLFDRYMIEEQFGWRVDEQLPDAIRIVDTVDLHSLRLERQRAVRFGESFSEESLIKSEPAWREFASMMRCDLSLLISDFEYNLVKRVGKFSDKKLFYLPFLLSPDESKPLTDTPSFAKRSDFVTIGNFRHPPNRDAVRQLKNEIWPLIRKFLPDAELHVYGSYPTGADLSLTDEKSGFIVKGRADKAKEVIETARVLLAPLRFGAGLKGKLLEAMRFGTPSVTTLVGAEGMTSDGDWNGFICDEPEAFARSAVSLHEDFNLWRTKQKAGYRILKERFDRTRFEKSFSERLQELLSENGEIQMNSLWANATRYHSFRSVRFMSKWIEEKNK